MKHQKGAALIVVLSLLTVSLMVGLSSMQSSQIDERLAGNYKAASQVQMAAEEAASSGWAFINGSGVDVAKVFSLSSLDLGQVDSLASFSNDQNFDGDAWVSGGCEEVECFYRLVEFDGEYFVVAMGSIGNGSLAVSTPVFVKLDVQSWTGFGPPSAVTLPGGIDEDIPNNALQWPKSENSKISGGDGFLDADGNVIDVAAMSLLQGEGLLSIDGAYEDKAGLDSSTVLALDQEPVSFVSLIKDMYDEYSSSPSGDYPGVYFYTGDNQMNFTGSHSLSGLHIVLNGSVQIGGNSHLDGALIVLNVDDLNSESSWTLSPSTFVKLNGGGGEGTVWFNGNNVENALSAFDMTLDDFYGVSAESNLVEGVNGIKNWF